MGWFRRRREDAERRILEVLERAEPYGLSGYPISKVARW